MTIKQDVENKIESWFDDLMSELRVHQVELETNTAPEHLKSFYKKIFSGKIEEMSKLNKELAQEHFVSSIVLDYLREINNHLPLKLALNYNDAAVLVWAEINDDDVETENKLLISEAKINAKYHQFGFDMSSIIVEKSDYLAVPNHYHKLI